MAPSLAGLIDSLDAQKTVFLDETEHEVYNYVSVQSRKQCVSIVEKDAYGKGSHRTHRFGLDSYVIVLGEFCLGRPYKGHELDSALSEPVVEVVARCLERYIEGKSDEIKAYVNQRIVEDKHLRETVLQMVSDELIKQGVKASREKLVKYFSDTLQQQVHHAASTHIGLAVQHGVAVAASSSVGAAIGKVLMKAISHHVGTVVSKVMAKTAAKKAVYAVVKKFTLPIVTGLVVKTLAAKFGISSAAALAHFLAWAAIGAYILKKIHGLPKELGQKVSRGVRVGISENSRSILSKSFENMKKDAFDPEKIRDAMLGQIHTSGLQTKIEGDIDRFNPDLPRLEKDVEHGVNKAYGFFPWWK